MKFKMKYYGSFAGLMSGKSYHFDKDQIIEAPEGDFDELTGLVESTKRTVNISSTEVETAAIAPQTSKRGRKKKK